MINYQKSVKNKLDFCLCRIVEFKQGVENETRFSKGNAF